MIRVRRYFEDGTVQEMIDPAEVSECLGQRGTLLWVDVEDITREDVACLAEEFDVHDLAAEDLLEPAPRPRLSRFADHHLLVVHDACLVDSRFAHREVDLLFGDGWLISVRKRPPGKDGPPTPYEELLKRFETQRRTEGSTDEGFLLYAILDTVVDRCFEVSDRLEDALEEIETEIFSEELGGPARESRIIQPLYELRSDLVRFRRSTAPLREALSALMRDSDNRFGDVAIVYLRDVFDLAIRLGDTADSLRELVNAALEAHLSIVSNRMNLVMKRATSWGAILVVATLVAGIYGMNFEHMPELGWEYGYVWALGLMGGITVTLYLMFKRKDWL